MVPSSSASSLPSARSRVSRAPQTARAVALAKPLPERVPWSELGPEFFTAWGYPRGEFMPEHVEILGQNGSGKSYFEKTILMERARLRGSRVVMICTKPADKTITSTGWPTVVEWPPAQGWTRNRKDYRQVIFWAKAQGLGRPGRERQSAAIEDLLEKLWVPDSNVIVVFDEIAYVEKELGLRPHVERYFREARALGITVVATTQRPQGVTRYMHSESAWSVFFAPKDEEDAERMAQVAGNKLYYMRVLAELRRPQYEFVMVHNLTGEAYISSLPKNAIPMRIKDHRKDVPAQRVPVA